MGCRSARHPEAAGGKYFSTFSRQSAKLSTSRRYILSTGVKQDPPGHRRRSTSNRIAVTRPSRYNSARWQAASSGVDACLAGIERSPAREFSFTVSLRILKEEE
jgi:hypothetical protein